MLNACSAEEIPSIFKEYTGIDLNERELMALKAHRFMTAADHMSIELSPNLSAEINKILTKHTHIGWTTYGHTGEDVFLAVYNPNDQRPVGFIRNVDINRYMRKVLGLKEDLETISDRIFVPHYEVFKHYDYAILEGADGPVLQVVDAGVTHHHIEQRTRRYVLYGEALFVEFDKALLHYILGHILGLDEPGCIVPQTGIILPE